MMIMRVGRVSEIRQDGAEMQHRRELNAELAGAVDCDADAERFAYAGRLDARADAAPERRVEQDDIDGAELFIRGQLLEVDDDGVRRNRQRDEVLEPRELRHAPHRILEIIVFEIEDA